MYTYFGARKVGYKLIVMQCAVHMTLK